MIWQSVTHFWTHKQGNSGSGGSVAKVTMEVD